MPLQVRQLQQQLFSAKAELQVFRQEMQTGQRDYQLLQRELKDQEAAMPDIVRELQERQMQLTGLQHELQTKTSELQHLRQQLEVAKEAATTAAAAAVAAAGMSTRANSPASAAAASVAVSRATSVELAAGKQQEAERGSASLPALEQHASSTSAATQADQPQEPTPALALKGTIVGSHGQQGMAGSTHLVEQQQRLQERMAAQDAVIGALRKKLAGSQAWAQELEESALQMQEGLNRRVAAAESEEAALNKDRVSYSS